MKRIEISVPVNDFNIETFSVNREHRKERILYYVNIVCSPEGLEFIRKSSSYLPEFLMAIGVNSRLIIGELEGVIKSPEEIPQWTYGNTNHSLEPSWFWEWFPTEETKGKLKEMGFSEKETQSIRIMRLPVLFKKNWVFEVEIKENPEPSYPTAPVADQIA